MDKCIGRELKRGKVEAVKLKEQISVFDVDYLHLVKNLFENRG